MELNSFSRFVVDFLSERRPELQAQITTLGPDQDMFEAGVVDSHAFLDLCLAIEERTGGIIDIAELDPEQFSSIRGLFNVSGAASAA